MNSHSPKKSATENVAETTHKCSYCGKSFLRSESNAMPFCSARCKQIDLGNWLSESYGLPFEGEEERQFGTEEDEDEPN